ncbi:hypothetical protein BGW38_006022 [Lunasporangiospora selenospora]|uniref:Pinin/SDK/MemA protein domain-containing protein n=1 Tax=Lunasporangiospora selenospora TaxID=979761 RepID=A0A9P6FP72_9FUNG|nr:hypothetical protein BGW38_006022 [Lunasporangiospora selenospora]
MPEPAGQARAQKRARREEVVPPSQLTATVASSTTTETTDAAAAAATATTTTTTATTAPPAKASESTPVVAEENNRRGRRMMGMILGTLTQFKKDHQKQATNDKGAASRAALQERVREKLKREQELNRELHEKERQERLVKRGVTGAGQKWDNGFILTETKPRLRYMPKVMNDATRQKLEEQLQLRGPSKAQATVAISSEANTGKDGDVDMTEPSHQDTIVEPENMEVNHDDATLSKDSENSPDKTGGGPTSEELGSNVKQDEKTESLSECETADVEMAKSPSRESKAEETETS